MSTVKTGFVKAAKSHEKPRSLQTGRARSHTITLPAKPNPSERRVYVSLRRIHVLAPTGKDFAVSGHTLKPVSYFNIPFTFSTSCVGGWQALPVQRYTVGLPSFGARVLANGSTGPVAASTTLFG